MRKYRVLQFMLALILAVSAGSVHASASSQSQQSGYFGTVSSLSADHPRAVAGETELRLDTAKGPVEITATPATRVRIPGLVEASLDEISIGDSVAVLAFGGQAISIQVKPAQPVRARHFTGIVTAVEEDGPLSIRDGQGRTISAPALTDVSDLHPGDLVTAVLEQNLASGSLLITGLDRATENLDRILAALEKAQQSKAAANLARGNSKGRPFSPGPTPAPDGIGAGRIRPELGALRGGTTFGPRLRHRGIHRCGTPEIDH